MTQAEYDLIQRNLPLEIALRIVSSLQVEDVCALGSCSRFWRNLCRSDHIWESLTKNRWPTLFGDPSPSLSDMRWKELYAATHRERASKATAAVKLVEQRCSLGLLESGDYKRLTESLASWQFSFKDVQMFLLKPNVNVLLNLVAVHYCILGLQVPAEDVADALVSCGIAERRVNVKWWKLGRWFYGFRLRDESHSRWVSLVDLARINGSDVLLVLGRGAVHEVLRIEISASNTTSTSWSLATT